MSQANIQIGSGIQQFRRDSAGGRLGPIPMVAVVNFEDNAAVESFRNSNSPIGTSESVHIPSGLDNLERRRTLIINNQGGSTIYIGGTSGVTINNGFPVEPGSEKSFEIGALIHVWAIASGVPSELRVLEMA